MICKVCENNIRNKPEQETCKCPKCGVVYHSLAMKKTYLQKRRPVPRINKIVAWFLFKIYFLSIRFNRRLKGEIQNQRFGEL